MTELNKSTNNVSPFSVRELLDLKDDSPTSSEVVSKRKESLLNEQMELQKVESEMGGEINDDDKNSSRFSRNNLQ